jgi:hypothetical protein
LDEREKNTWIEQRERKMSKRVKKQASSMSFGLSRWFRRFSKPSSATFIVIVVAFATFLLGGGLLTIITRPPVAIYSGTRFFFIYPSMDAQLGMDTIFSAMLYAVGLIGLLLIYRSTKNAYKPRQAYMTLIVGVALFLLAYIFLESSILFKLNRGA